VREVGGRGTADGGVDLVLVREGETTVVQAKHWRRDRVGVALVRELYGVQTAQRADRAAFVALGSYSTDAQEFAAQVGMTLVDGEELLEIIGTGLRSEALELPTPTAASAPPCPRCGAVMVRRITRHGPHAGHDFWGCSSFPACRGTVAIPDEVPIAL
jgi:restriction system protein